MADPLTLLREYNICKKEIIEKKKLVIFGDCAFQKDVNTKYRTYMSMKEGTNYCYTLECLLFFLKNFHLFHRDYCKEAAAANVPEVGRPDRKNLLAYLNGETESSPSIVKGTPPNVELKERHRIMADPVTLLREYHMYKKEIIEKENLIIFGEYVFPKDVNTSYRSNRNVKYGIQECYTLECLLFFLKNIHVIHPEYCKKAAAENVPAVWRPDRKCLLAYLNGEMESYPSIVKVAFKGDFKRKPYGYW